MARSPLHRLHERVGARFVDFAGWEMPLRYRGVIAEHLAVRHEAGVFDVSHLGRFSVEGPGTTPLLRRLLCNDAAAARPGRAQYTMMLNEAGGVVDDIILWRWEEHGYWVMPNSANYESVIETFSAEAPPGVEVTGLRETTALLAVQGPQAPDLLARSVGWRPRRFHVEQFDTAGTPIRAAGTGYTGESGAELALPNQSAGDLFELFIEAGATPCGLGARDTLRLEMGYPLSGQDLDASTTPLEAGLGWVVDWEHDFIGKDRLAEQRQGALTKRRVGFVMEDRQIPRPGHRLRCGTAEGTVTSGNYSPVLERGIGMGFVSPPPGLDDTSIEVEVRGRYLPARRVEPPFVGRD
ncbi:MAG: glycine cleavage system aminomethyltransferase GcvT [Acidimicrobiia bacterium]